MRRWIVGFIASAAWLAAQPSSAAYNSMSWIDLACGADRIVTGTITAVNGSWNEDEQTDGSQPRAVPTVALLVDDQIAGPGTVGETIIVRQFHDWPCAWRWEPYAVGQTVMMFLEVDKYNGGMLTTMGAGNEGESAVVLASSGERYVCEGDPNDDPQLFNSHRYAEFRTAIADCRHSFRLVRAADPFVDAGGVRKFVPYESIVQVAAEPAPTSFRRRAPPGTAPKVVPFKNRSATHWLIYQKIETERLQIALYRGQAERPREITIVAPRPTVD